jgi:hypothetical protein
MTKLLAILSASFLLGSASLAVTWDVVNLTVSVKQGGTGEITTTILTSRDYLNFVSSRDGVPRSDLFVGFREDTGVIAVVQISSETVRYNVVSGFGPAGIASNGTNTKFSVSGPAVVSSLNTDFQGYIYDSAKRFRDGSVKSVARLFFGGFENQTIRGIARSTGRKIEL